MVVIHVNWLSTGNQIKIVKIEKENFSDAVAHCELIMQRKDVLGVQITWEKGSQ